jgi:hypothetical protein
MGRYAREVSMPLTMRKDQVESAAFDVAHGLLRVALQDGDEVGI